MATIYTASATNNGFYLTFAVAADSEASATAAFDAFLDETNAGESEDTGGEYEGGNDVTARLADGDGWYANDSTTSLDLNSREWAVEEALANPGTVVMLDSGANG